MHHHSHWRFDADGLARFRQAQQQCKKDLANEPATPEAIAAARAADCEILPGMLGSQLAAIQILLHKLSKGRLSV